MKLIGLDIGTTTICGLVLDSGSGEILSVVTRPNTSGIPGKAAWEALQDPSAILRIVRELVEGFLDRFNDVSAIGVAGQMHGILYVDKAGRECSPLYTWQDGRGDLLERDGPSTAARLSAALGSRVSTGMGIVTHAFNAAHGLVPREAASAVHHRRLRGHELERQHRAPDGHLQRGKPGLLRLCAAGFQTRCHCRISDSMPGSFPR